MADGGYRTPQLWLSGRLVHDQVRGLNAPLYWREIDGTWHSLTLSGLRPIDLAAPVMHVSYFEADAFARWAGKFLPTEAEWEVAARTNKLSNAFGIVWQWTRSAYLPYPGYRAAEGALGEYNGKFMVSQMVLRGVHRDARQPFARQLPQLFIHPTAGSSWPSALRLRRLKRRARFPHDEVSDAYFIATGRPRRTDCAHDLRRGCGRGAHRLPKWPRRTFHDRIVWLSRRLPAAGILPDPLRAER
jgi:hypothetical protein